MKRRSDRPTPRGHSASKCRNVVVVCGCRPVLGIGTRCNNKGVVGSRFAIGIGNQRSVHALGTHCGFVAVFRRKTILCKLGM